MLEVILIAIAWRRGWGAKALLPTVTLIVLLFLCGILGIASLDSSPTLLIASVIEYMALGIMIFSRP